MGKGCDTLKGISEDLFHWVYPEEVDPPECVMELLKRIYPTIDWSSVAFHKGLPGFVSWFAVGYGITLPSTWGLHQVNVYIEEDDWDPCTCAGLAAFVHESFHVLQYRDVLGGWGLGFLHPFILAYGACAFYADQDGVIEKPAYEQSGHFETCCYGSADKVCDCTTDPPTYNSAALDALIVSCPDLVKTSSGFSFWNSVWECTPGLSSLWELAGKLTDKACNIEWKPGADGGSPPWWALPKSLALAFAKLLAYCGPAFLLSLVIRLFALAYYLIWLVFMSIITIFYMVVIKMIAELVVLIVDGILWIVTGIVCGAEWIWEQIVGGFQKACEWATSTRAECTEWGEQERLECTEYREETVKECTEERDEGYRDCCDWWPCSWACDAWTWVSNIVCIAWAWVKHTFCVIWVSIKEKVCVAFAAVVDALTCWSK